MSEWKTMDSAPKDGTDVLLHGPSVSWKRPPVVAGWFGEPETDQPGWYSYDEPEELLRFSPTHWMPLPAPPITSPD